LLQCGKESNTLFLRAHLLRVHAEYHQPLWPLSHRRLQQVSQRLQQQSGAHEQHHAHCNLRHNHRIARTHLLRTRLRYRRRTAQQTLRSIRHRRPQRRQPKDDRQQNQHAQCQPEHLEIGLQIRLNPRP